MRCAITGATGLLGANLAAELCARGHEVVATRRATSVTSHLDDLDIDWVEAPLRDVEGLTRTFDGADWVFHCAAAVSVRYEVTPWIYDANVTGTANVIDAVRAADAGRLVHCSTVTAIGVSEDGNPSTEESRWNLPELRLDDAYARTKRTAQELVLAETRRGFDAVIVNPSYMIGPRDRRPSSGELVLRLVRGKIPFVVPGVNNFVDVRDVARGMILAAEDGDAGEMYILGGENMSYREFFAMVSEVTGAPRAKLPIPRWLAMIGGVVGDLQGRLLGRDPKLTSAVVRWSFVDGYIFSSEKARRELGYETSPLEPAIADAVQWFREHDML